MVYLDNAATGYPKPPRVVRALAGVTEKIGGSAGRGGHAGALAAGRVLLACREQICQMTGGHAPERAVLTYNCTHAINFALYGLLRRGDHVLTSHGEHNAVMRALSHLQARGDITFDTVAPRKNGLLDARDALAAVRGDTALFVLCHASNVTGVVQPAREIARALHTRGVPLLLDAAQTAGTLDLCDIGADIIALPGHKGMLGPAGTGALVAAPGIQLRAMLQGGTGSQSDSLSQPDFLPDALESGTQNVPGAAGLLQGARFAHKHMGEIHEYEMALDALLRAYLRAVRGVTVYARDDAPRVAVTSFTVAGMETAQVTDILCAQDIRVRGGLHCAPMMHRYLGTLDGGTVRVSLGPFNTKSDVEALARAVESIASGGRTQFAPAGG